MKLTIRLATAALSLLLAAPAAAQQTVYVRQAAPAWLGISYELRWVQQNGACSPRVVVDAVVQGSPAERAGLRSGDAIISLDGQPVPPGRLEAFAARLAPGDAVRLQVRRDGTVRDITAVADRRPDRPLSVFMEPSSAPPASAAPFIQVVADTLIARNVGDGTRSPTRSYWVRGDDGRIQYRTINTRSLTEFDRRVVDLLACADSARVRSPDYPNVTTAVHANIQRLQQRADSLRVIITQRALQREQSEGGFTFRVSGHLDAGLRGVGGAEITPLEPELAEYFRNVDHGLLVLRIAPESPAQRAGLRPGDVIIAADGRRLQTVAELLRIVSFPSADPVQIRLVRRGRTRDIDLRRN